MVTGVVVMVTSVVVMVTGVVVMVTGVVVMVTGRGVVVMVTRVVVMVTGVVVMVTSVVVMVTSVVVMVTGVVVMVTGVVVMVTGVVVMVTSVVVMVTSVVVMVTSVVVMVTCILYSCQGNRCKDFKISLFSLDQLIIYYIIIMLFKNLWSINFVNTRISYSLILPSKLHTITYLSHICHTFVTHMSLKHLTLSTEVRLSSPQQQILSYHALGLDQGNSLCHVVL